MVVLRIMTLTLKSSRFMMMIKEIKRRDRNQQILKMNMILMMISLMIRKLMTRRFLRMCQLFMVDFMSTQGHLSLKLMEGQPMMTRIKRDKLEAHFKPLFYLVIKKCNVGINRILMVKDFYQNLHI